MPRRPAGTASGRRWDTSWSHADMRAESLPSARLLACPHVCPAGRGHTSGPCPARRGGRHPPLREPGAGRVASAGSQRPRLESALNEVPLRMKNEDLGGARVWTVFREVLWSLAEKRGQASGVGQGLLRSLRQEGHRKRKGRLSGSVPARPRLPRLPRVLLQEVYRVRRKPVSRLEKPKGGQSPRAW